MPLLNLLYFSIKDRISKWTKVVLKAIYNMGFLNFVLTIIGILVICVLVHSSKDVSDKVPELSVKPPTTPKQQDGQKNIIYCSEDVCGDSLDFSVKPPTTQIQKPKKATTEPKKGTSEPKKGTTEPKKGTTEPKKGTTQPKKATTQPKKATTQPKKDTTQPKKNTTQPKKDTTQPKKGTTKPKKDTTQPKKGTTQPKKGTTQPKKGSTKPKKQGGQKKKIPDSLCHQHRTCMSLRHCAHFRDVVQVEEQNLCGMENDGTPRVCCPKPAMVWMKMEYKKKEEVKPKQFPKQREKKGGKGGDQLADLPNLHLLPLKTCGRLSRSKTNTTTGSQSIQPHPYPWLAFIVVYDNVTRNEGYCDGTLISKRYVLTTALCVYDGLVVWDVWLGIHSMSSIKKKFHTYPAELTARYLHFTPERMQNNIALIRLDRDVVFTVNIQPICLPVFTDRWPLENKLGSVIGRGITNKKVDDVPKEVKVPVFRMKDCRKVYPPMSYDLPMVLGDSQMCGASIPDGCGANGGSPMTYITTVQGELAYVQYGILSFRPRDCDKMQRVPRIFTNVQALIKWILENIF